MEKDEIVLSDYLHRCLKRHADNTKLQEPTFHVTRGSNKGDNFVGVIYRVKIEGTEKHGKRRTVHLILKTVPTDIPSNIIRTGKLYQREIFFYREVVPTFEKILSERGVMADLFPALYDANDESGKEFLMLENLNRAGFEMKATKMLDYPHLALALRRLGEFHGYSFVVRAVDPTSFDRFRRMEDPIFVRENVYDKSKHPTQLVDIVAKALMDEDKHYIERFRGFADNFMRNMVDATDGSLAEPYAVVNHGDAWTNNILFKYSQKSQGDSQEKIPYDLRFLDFQLCRYASPVLDILYILFCCCTQETRRKHYDRLIEIYYESLSKCLERFGCDPNVLFPREALSQQLVTYGKYAAGVAIYVIHIFTSTGDDAERDINRYFDKDKLEERLQNDSFYRSMLKGTFKDLVDMNYI